MRKLSNIVFFVLSTLAGANSYALIISGADLATDPNVTLPNGNDGIVGTSMLFSNPPSFPIIVNLDVDSLGIGTGAGQLSNGSIAITNTRLGIDSDLWFGLWDGVSFAAITSFDGNRSQAQSGATSDGLTVNFVGGGTTTSWTSVQAIGSMITGNYMYDLVARTADLSIGGIISTINFAPTFNTGANLAFLVGIGAPGESHQIDQIEISGLTRDVPEPSTLVLLALGLFGLILPRLRSAQH